MLVEVERREECRESRLPFEAGRVVGDEAPDPTCSNGTCAFLFDQLHSPLHLAFRLAGWTLAWSLAKSKAENSLVEHFFIGSIGKEVEDEAVSVKLV